VKLKQLFEAGRRTTIKGSSDMGSYPVYIRSIAKLKEALKEKYGNPKITLDNIIKLYAEFDMKLTDNLLEFDFPVKDLDRYKEFDRGTTSNLSDEDMESLKADIKKNGITDYGVFEMRKKRNGDVIAFLGEGNHRLHIAKQLNIRSMKVRLYYGEA
jgi:hypothetical protein